MIAALRHRRWGLAWLLLMVPLAVGLAWLASVPLLRANRTLLDPGPETCHRWAGTDGLPRHYFIGAESTVLREVIGPLEPARMVAVLEDLLGGHSIGHIGARSVIAHDFDR